MNCQHTLKNNNHVSSILFLSAFILFVLSFSFPVTAEKLYRFDDIVVKGEGASRSLLAHGSMLTVIDRDEIENMGADSISDILSHISSIKVSERGTPGSQADLSMRGSTYDSVLLLVDGVRMHDPQTGHFTFDLPYDLNTVDHIEILSAGSAGKYGASASGGIINIVTRKEGPTTSGSLRAGSFGYGKTSSSAYTIIGNSKVGINFNVLRSDGYRKGSDIESGAFALNGSTQARSMKLDWSAGLIKKRFGAADFYGAWPSYEKTMTVHATVNAVHVFDSSSLLRFRISSRGHEDDYMLLRDNPLYYRNTHYSRSMLFASEYLKSSSFGEILFGAETERVGITSGSLGNHGDVSTALYSEIGTSFNVVDLSASMRMEKTITGDVVFSPGFGAVLPAGKKTRLRLRAERLFRSPTYTELYYASPSNLGNPKLKSEKSDCIEIGADTAFSNITVATSFFGKRSHDVIDWIRPDSGSPWCAANHATVETLGIECATTYHITERWRANSSLTVLDQRVSGRQGIESKYALNAPDDTIAVSLFGPMTNTIRTTIGLRHEQGGYGGDRTPVSIGISQAFGSATARISAENVLNEHYYDFPGLPAPGRWLYAGIDYNVTP